MISQQMPLRFYRYFVLLLAIGCSLHFAAAENETEWMPDEHLRAAVREALALEPDVSFTPQVLEALTELPATRYPMQREIRSLKGLEYATRLEVLTLFWTPVVDLTPLAGLTRLKVLHLRDNNIIDLTPLASLTGLQELYLDDNQINDVSVLTQLTNLEVLHIQPNPIQDVTPLQILRKSNPQITISD